MYPPRAWTTRPFFRVRISSGCHPGRAPGSKLISYRCRSSVNKSEMAVEMCADVLAMRMSRPVQRANLERRSLRCTAVARDLEFCARMIGRVDDRQQVNRHVDGARHTGNFRSGARAARIHAVADDQQCAVLLVACGDCSCPPSDRTSMISASRTDRGAATRDGREGRAAPVRHGRLPVMSWMALTTPAHVLRCRERTRRPSAVSGRTTASLRLLDHRPCSQPRSSRRYSSGYSEAIWNFSCPSIAPRSSC